MMSECMTQEDAMNMSNEQAVQILKPFRDMMLDQHGCPISDAFFALGKAIEALKREERKKGKWIHHTDWEHDGECAYECSVCGMGSDVDYDFCMRCGADMRGEDDE